MVRKKKLRLRKQVIISFPIACMITLLIVGLIINKNKTFAYEISQSSEIISENNVVDGKKLSDIPYFTELNTRIQKRQKDNTVIYYADKFKLNINKTLEIVHKLTNNYDDAAYNKNNIIAPQNLVSKLKAFDSFEAGVVYFIRDLYRYPENYGSSIEEIRLDETPTVNNNVKNGIIYMENGLTFEQYVGKICDLFGVNKSLTLAIIHEESGAMTSGLFKYNNNIGGLRGYGGWMSFTTLEAGVIAHVISVKSLADKYNIDTNASDAAGRLSGVYVKGNPNSYSESWTGKVINYKNKIEQKDLFTIKE